MRRSHFLLGLCLCTTNICAPSSAAQAADSQAEVVAAKLPPIKIFIAAGQSNMEGPADVADLTELAPELLKPRTDVHCVYAGMPSGPLAPGFGFRSDKFGPELSFGHVMGAALENRVLIIKSAVGGTNLHEDWRSPSMLKRAGGRIGLLYTRMIQRVHSLIQHLAEFDPEYKGQGYELAGFIWMQGESDATPTLAPHYEENLKDFISDVRTHLGVPELPFVIGQINDSSAWDEGGKKGPVIRAAQAAVAAALPHTSMIVTKDLDSGYHYDSKSHITIGERFAQATLELLQEERQACDAEKVAAAFVDFDVNVMKARIRRGRGIVHGILGYWTFDEGKGRVVADRSPKGDLPAKLGEGAAWVSGIRGSAVRLDSGETITIDGFAAPVNEAGRIAAFTLSFWIQTPLKGGGIYIAQEDKDKRLGWRVGNFANQSWAHLVINLGAEGQQEMHGSWGDARMHGDGHEWHHVAFVYDAAKSEMRTWVDAKRVSIGPEKIDAGGIRPSNGPIVIGCELHGDGNFFSIDEIGIWGRALGERNIHGLYANGRGLPLPVDEEAVEPGARGR